MFSRKAVETRTWTTQKRLRTAVSDQNFALRRGSYDRFTKLCWQNGFFEICEFSGQYGDWAENLAAPGKKNRLTAWKLCPIYEIMLTNGIFEICEFSAQYGDWAENLTAPRKKKIVGKKSNGCEFPATASSEHPYNIAKRFGTAV